VTSANLNIPRCPSCGFPEHGSVACEAVRLPANPVPVEPPEVETLCPRCQLRPAQSDHPCPYQSEINDDEETLCDCCEDCAQECAWDI
jgi:hypothetical protein